MAPISDASVVRFPLDRYFLRLGGNRCFNICAGNRDREIELNDGSGSIKDSRMPLYRPATEIKVNALTESQKFISYVSYSVFKLLCKSSSEKPPQRRQAKKVQ